MHRIGKHENLCSIHAHINRNLSLKQILSGYMIVTLIIISVGEHHQMNDFNDFQLCLFAF
jgi:hypothetical protein